MYRLASMIATVALLLSADASGVLRIPPPGQAFYFPQDQNPTAPADSPPSGDPPKRKLKIPPDDSDQPAKSQAGPMQPMSRLSLVRYVDGELVQVVRPIPAGKKGLHLKAGAPMDEKALRMAVASAGSAINPGDHAQITDLEFKDKEIIVDINGGGKGKTKLRDRIHLEVGGVPTMTTSQDTRVNTSAGATIYLDFDKPLPDMSAEELEQFLSGVLDFSKRHSAAVQWVESLPPDIQKAIEEKQPVVGMDHDMVLAAMGRPDRKVREKGPDGNEIEDWIYGKPPAKTIFVSFEGDKVTQVHEYPQ
jgi:hypothetical protein